MKCFSRAKSFFGFGFRARSVQHLNSQFSNCLLNESNLEEVAGFISHSGVNVCFTTFDVVV